MSFSRCADIVKWGVESKLRVIGIRAQLSQKKIVVNVQKKKKKIDRENAQKIIP